MPQGPRPAPNIGGVKFKYATFAESRTGHLGKEYYIAKGVYGKGLFANKALRPGDVICPYDGQLISSSDAQSKSRVKTHMLKLVGSSLIVDGLLLAQELSFDKTDQKYWPRDIDMWDSGFGSIANSSAGSGSANAKMIFLFDDRDIRAGDYDPETQQRLPNRVIDLMNTRAYLVASEDIAKNEEIFWYYNPTLYEPDVIDLTELGGGSGCGCCSRCRCR